MEGMHTVQCKCECTVCLGKFLACEAQTLEKQEEEHFNWLTLWHQRLLSAISDAEKVSSACSAYPGWKSFKQLVLKSTEEVVEAKEVLQAQLSAARDQRELRRIEEALQSRRAELNETRMARKGCLEEIVSHGHLRILCIYIYLYPHPI